MLNLIKNNKFNNFCKRSLLNAIVDFINFNDDLHSFVNGNVKNVFINVTDDSNNSVDFVLSVVNLND